MKVRLFRGRTLLFDRNSEWLRFSVTQLLQSERLFVPHFGHCRARSKISGLECRR
jgi:hypothetical protein